jgi:4-amino-4-deoxy-L-arabinose transferase-like glycosyltransferase
VVTPIFEAGDEIWHYPLVQYLATGHGLPVQDPAHPQAWRQEGGQPPLYYAVAALFTFWIDTSDLPERLYYNPHAQIGIPLAYGNKNMVVHTEAEKFPWRGTVLAVHLVRFLSILFSAGTVALTYLLAKTIASSFRKLPGEEELPLVAAALVAFNPMFLFISASVNNDNLAVLLSTLALLLLVRLFTQKANHAQLFLLGIILGLAALTKVSTLGLLPLTGLTLLFMAWCQRDWSLLLKGGFMITALVLALAGWWYLRNWLLYGDPFGWNVWLAIAGKRPNPVSLLDLLAEFEGFRISYWGNFGAVNIIAPKWVYVTLDMLSVLACLGLILGLFRRQLPALLWLPFFWLAIIFIALVRWTLLTYASQGRLIFPAISAVGILMAWGLSQLPLRKIILAFSMAFLLLFATAAPFALIAPTYKPPRRIDSETLVPNRVHIVYNGQAELVGYSLSRKSVWPGESLPLTLYWRALAPMDEDFSVYIHLHDAQTRKVIGQWDAYPGNGLHPTRLWRVGEIFADEYRVPIRADAVGPRLAWIQVGLYRRSTMQNLEAKDPTGNSITPILGRFKVSGPRREIQMDHQGHFLFGDQIELIGFSVGTPGKCSETTCLVYPGDHLPVRLLWRAIETPREDFTVFVHLLDVGNRLISQQDSQPQNGTYPTSFWDPGEIVPDWHELLIPSDATPGDYTIALGLYHLSDGTRLPVAGLGDKVLLPIRIQVKSPEN